MKSTICETADGTIREYSLEDGQLLQVAIIPFNGNPWNIAIDINRQLLLVDDHRNGRSVVHILHRMGAEWQAIRLPVKHENNMIIHCWSRVGMHKMAFVDWRFDYLHICEYS